MQRAVNGNNIALRHQLGKVRDPPAANLLLLIRRKGLVVVVQQLLAVERLQPPQDPLADPANTNGTNDLALEVILVLSHRRDVPVTALDLLVRGHKVADEEQDRHDDVLGDRDDVGASDLGDGDTAVGLVGGVEIDVVGADAGRDG